MKNFSRFLSSIAYKQIQVQVGGNDIEFYIVEKQTDTVTGYTSLEAAQAAARALVPSGATIGDWVTTSDMTPLSGNTSTYTSTTSLEDAKNSARNAIPEGCILGSWTTTSNVAPQNKTTSTVSNKNSHLEADSAARALVPEGSVNVQVSSSSGQPVSVGNGDSFWYGGDAKKYNSVNEAKAAAEADARQRLLRQYPNATIVSVSSDESDHYSYCFASATGIINVWSAYATYTIPGSYAGYYSYSRVNNYGGYYKYTEIELVYLSKSATTETDNYTTEQKAKDAVRALVPRDAKPSSIKVTASKSRDESVNVGEDQLFSSENEAIENAKSRLQTQYPDAISIAGTSRPVVSASETKYYGSATGTLEYFTGNVTYEVPQYKYNDFNASVEAIYNSASEAEAALRAKLPSDAVNIQITTNYTTTSHTIQHVSDKNSREEAEAAVRLFPEGSVDMQVSSSSTGKSVNFIDTYYFYYGSIRDYTPWYNSIDEGRAAAEADARQNLLNKYPNATNVVTESDYNDWGIQIECYASASGTILVWSAVATYKLIDKYSATATYQVPKYIEQGVPVYETRWVEE